MSPPNRSFHDDEENKSPQLAEFEALLQEYDYDFKRGEVVRGAVASIDDSGALVDIGAKMVAFLPNKEVGQNVRSAREALKVGETQEFIILSEEDEEGQLTLSLKRVQYAQNWKRLEELMEADEVVECQVSAVVKGGLLVEIFNLRGFIPSSHLRVKQTLDSLVGETLKAKIINLDKARNNIILSHRKLMSEVQRQLPTTHLFRNKTCTATTSPLKRRRKKSLQKLTYVPKLRANQFLLRQLHRYHHLRLPHQKNLLQFRNLRRT